ncbi:MAG: glycyl-radical enzyme activating protein [Anaerolineales bacterium]|nr:glycyl-radical enzyme activating protein [Anaerolineales bacterium]
MTTGIIFDIRKYSIHDGPGIRTTVFFKGCPLNCWWCHNPESQASSVEIMYHENRCIRCGACLEICTRGALSWDTDLIILDKEKCDLCGDCADACYTEARQMVGQEMTISQAMAEIERDIAFYDQSGGGVTLSGGEPLLQQDFLHALLQACKEKEIHTALDTCGFAPWEILDRVREYVDLFLYDLKLMEDGKHRQFTGVSNELILRNLQALSSYGHHIILRLPVIPGINDDDDSVRQIGAFCAALPHLDGIDILPYHRIGLDKYSRLNMDYKLTEISSPSSDKIADIAQILQELGLPVKIGDLKNDK